MRTFSATSVLLLLSCPRNASAQGGADPAARHLEAVEALRARRDLPWNPTAILVRFSPEAGEGLRAHARGRVGRGALKRFDLVEGLELVDVRTGVSQAIAAIRPYVEYAEPDYVVREASTPNDPNFGFQWALHNTGQSVGGDPGTADADIDGVEAWNVSTGDPDFVVAILDTGTQYTHPDLAANIWSNPGEIAGNGLDDDGNGYVDDVRGWDFFDHDNDPDDPNGHGTHTAGTVGAVGNNGLGVAGVNWRCKLMPLRFLGPSGGYTSDAVLAIQYAAQKGVRISNNSWGGGAFSQSLQDAIQASGSVGHLFCAAAGNNGRNIDSSPFYPASYALDNVISVAATDNDDARASFSNYGVGSVDLGAPGVSIASTYPGNAYVYMSGTSMATPHVAGVAALVCARNPGWSYGEVRDRLLSTVRPAASMTGVSASGGILDAAAALGAPPPNLPPATPGSATAVDLNGGSARISWTDASANETGFEVQRETRVGNQYRNPTIVGTTGANGTSFVDTPGSGRFRYRVRAFNAAGSSSWTGWANVRVR